MATTFKFGNKNWAVKEDYVLAYNDENNNFKPLPFDFTRATTATYVDSDGLIKTANSGYARIDYKDNTDGHLLLEPSRTNLITYSEGFSNWTIKSSGVVVTDNTTEVLSPSGENNASKVEFNAANKILGVTPTLSGSYSGFIYVKGTSGETIRFNFAGTEENFTLTGGWDKLERTNITSSANAFNLNTYTGVTARNIYVWGAQLEAGSYPTSYIPTEGSSVTRNVDDIALTFPDADSYTSSNGFSIVAKFDIGAAGTGTSAPFLIFYDDTSFTYIGFGSTNSLFRCRLNLSGTAYLNTQSNAPRTQRNSLFVSCDSSGWSQGANGLTNNTGSNDASVFNKLSNIQYTPSEIYGIIKITELLIYNTRLTDSELETLTT